MTSPYVTFSPPPVPPRPSSWPVFKAMLAVLVLIGSGFLALVAGFAAIIVWSGCFIECTGGDHLRGAALALLAVTLLTAGPLLGYVMYRHRAWLAAAGFAATGGGMLLVAALAHN